VTPLAALLAAAEATHLAATAVRHAVREHPQPRSGVRRELVAAQRHADDALAHLHEAHRLARGAP